MHSTQVKLSTLRGYPLKAVGVLDIFLLLLDILAQHSWGNAQQALEMAVQMTLISKPHRMGDFCQRKVTLQYERLGTLHPAGHEILVGSQTKGLLEEAREVRDT
jgi:hypothetical protein